ncbi:hypothetical protein NUU00_10050 (plasmid) [Bifidobacterium breve]|jgi:hypothetical protein|uniref:Uncharacterized protein n=1 Tax=Faecalibacterium prausnitzii TaxID=853 RepID=A0A9E1GMW6_9FIRM|nr:hypothetical protein [Bifidobacterium breve]MBS6623270.1 hypothetical protein [Faecalibacterium prausnitzii]UUY18124.1 hypothetical protein NUU00_10050 [Bifidobacterium breve]
MTSTQDQQKIEERKQSPDYGTAFALSILLPAALIAVLFMAGYKTIGWGLTALVAALFVVGIFWRPIRSGASPAIVYMVPVWGMVARADRVDTCAALRTAKIYNDPDKTHVIPATTWKQRGDTYVFFDGGGEAGMAPDHLKELLQLNARVWRCRSFAISEDSKRPGRITLQLSPGETVQTALDRPITGVVA